MRVGMVVLVILDERKRGWSGVVLVFVLAEHRAVGCAEVRHRCLKLADLACPHAGTSCGPPSLAGRTVWLHFSSACAFECGLELLLGFELWQPAEVLWQVPVPVAE